MLAHGASAATATASAATGRRRRAKLIALGLEFRRIDPAQVRADGAVAMYAAPQIRGAVEIQVGQYIAVARGTAGGREGR